MCATSIFVVSPTVQGVASVMHRAAPLTAWELMQDTVGYLYKNFWPLMLIFALTDLSMFALHRISHRITNEGKNIDTCHFCNPDIALHDARPIVRELWQ